MQINSKMFHGTSIIFSVITIISVFLISIEIAMLFVGFSQLFNGLYQVKLSQSIENEEPHKGNKAVGIFSILVGLVIIITYIIKLIF